MAKNRRHDIVKPSKYKTTLCSFFYSKDGCPFGERCAFAHGTEELRSEATEERPAASATPPTTSVGGDKDDVGVCSTMTPEAVCSTAHVTNNCAQTLSLTKIASLPVAGGDRTGAAAPESGAYHSAVSNSHKSASLATPVEATLVGASMLRNERCEVHSGGAMRTDDAEKGVGATTSTAKVKPTTHIGTHGPHRKPNQQCTTDDVTRLHSNAVAAWQMPTTASSAHHATLCRDALGANSTTLPSGIAQHPYFNINNHHHINVVPAAPATFLVATGPPPFVSSQARKSSHPPPRVLRSSMPQRHQPRIRHTSRPAETSYMIYHPSTTPQTTPIPCGPQSGPNPALSAPLVVPAIVPSSSSLPGGPIALTVAAAGSSMHDAGLGPPAVALVPPSFGYETRAMSGVINYTNVACPPPHPGLTTTPTGATASATMQIPLGAQCEAATWPSTAAAYYYMAVQQQQQQQQLCVEGSGQPSQQPPAALPTSVSPLPHTSAAAGDAPSPQPADTAAVGSSAGQVEAPMTLPSTAMYKLFGAMDSTTLTMPSTAEVEEGISNDLGSEWAALMERWMFNLKDDNARASPAEAEDTPHASTPPGGTEGTLSTESARASPAATIEARTESSVAAPLGNPCPPSLRGRPLQVHVEGSTPSHSITTVPETVGGVSDNTAACTSSTQLRQRLGPARRLSSVRTSGASGQRICATLWEGMKTSTQRQPIVSNQFKSSCKAESTLNSILLDYPEQMSLLPSVCTTAFLPRPGIDELFRGLRRRKMPMRTKVTGQGNVVAELLSSAKEKGIRPTTLAMDKKIAAPPPPPPHTPRKADNVGDNALSIEYYI